VFAGCGAAERIGFELHEAFGGKADHFAWERRVGAFLQQCAKGDLVIGHRGGPRESCTPQHYPQSPR